MDGIRMHPKAVFFLKKSRNRGIGLRGNLPTPSGNLLGVRGELGLPRL